MAIQEGDKLPEATLYVMEDGKPTPKTTADLFGGKKVVVFAVPGAFTPTCSQAHLPGFVVNADAIKSKGVDSIVCISVNDAFVMDSWGQDKNAEEIIMAPALEKLRAQGLEATCKIRYGSVVEIISEEAEKSGASLIIVGRSGANSIAARVFGSVPIGLARIAPVPTVIVP